MKRAIIIAFTVTLAEMLICSPVQAKTGSIPIVAYMGVPGNLSSDKSFKDFKQTGFDICISNYSYWIPSLTGNAIGIANLSAMIGAFISVFSKDNHQYLAIVNKDHQHYMKVFIEAKNDKPVHITKKLKTEKLKSSYTVSGGDILLFRLK